MTTPIIPQARKVGDKVKWKDPSGIAHHGTIKELKNGGAVVQDDKTPPNTFIVPKADLEDDV